MKRIVSLAVCLGLALPVLAVQRAGQLPRTANSFAPMSDYTDGSGQISSHYLLAKMMRGEPIYIALKYDKLPFSLSETQDFIAKIYAKWVTQTAQQIRSAKREEEFADNLRVLDQDVRVEFVEENPDITFHFLGIEEIWEIRQSRSTAGFYTHSDGHSHIVLPHDLARVEKLANDPEKLRNFYSNLMMHEAGHSIGFAEAYEEGRLAADQLYGTADPDEHSIMSDEVSLEELKLSCGDATGVINLMDITNNYTQRGGEKGWKSLCPKSKEYFIHNVSCLKGSYKIEFGAKDIAVSTYKDGKIVKDLYPLSSDMYAPYEKVELASIEEKDPVGRPIRATTTRGELVFINYLYESRRVVVIRGGQAVYLRYDKSAPSKHSREVYWLYKQGDNSGYFKVTLNAQSRVLEMQLGPVDEEGAFQPGSTAMSRVYDGKGNLKKQHIPDYSTAVTSVIINDKEMVAEQKSRPTPLSLEQQVEREQRNAQLDNLVKNMKLEEKFAKKLPIVF